MTKNAPILLRAFKKEAELEIWKMKTNGEYALLKSYPMCRWSGQLGPKRREGDRQVPEGFYAITPQKMNPNSAYYLSFDVGYPNAYDRAHNSTGSLIMVHGACSSAGCFSMTDEQIAEIYAITREAFSGGQPALQMQSMPFRMTPENLAAHRFDANMKFWRQIKEGSDHFEITRKEPQVAVCGQRYVFNAKPKDASARLDARAACPPFEQEETLKNMVAEKNQREQTKIAELVSKGAPAIKISYADGGQHPSFKHVTVVSRPEAIDREPVEILIDEKGRPIKTPVMVAGRTDKSNISAKSSAGQAATADAAAKPAPNAIAVSSTGKPPASNNSSMPASATAFAPASSTETAASASESFYRRWLGGEAKTETATEAQPAANVTAPVAKPAAVPVPPKRDKQANALPLMIRGSAPALPAGLLAYASAD